MRGQAREGMKEWGSRSEGVGHTERRGGAHGAKGWVSGTVSSRLMRGLHRLRYATVVL